MEFLMFNVEFLISESPCSIISQYKIDGPPKFKKPLSVIPAKEAVS